jgi:hypothetical protein
MNRCMNKTVRNWLILATLIVVTLLAILWATSTSWLPPSPWGHRLPPVLPPPYEIAEDWEFFYAAETVISTINAALSIFLLLIYVDIYRKTRSEFTIGLIIFSAVLLLHAITSIPFVYHAFGFGWFVFSLGPFAMLPDLFTCAALVVLLFLSVKY